MIDTAAVKRLEQRYIWERDYTREPVWLRLPVEVARTVFFVARELSSGDLNLRAMSLVYTTILSLVPLLAFSFSVLKGFGVQNQVEPALLEYLAPLGPEKSTEIASKLVEFVSNIDVRVLGAIGLGLLLYTIVTLMQKIERAFNVAWHIETHRSFSERFTTFISVLTVGPLLVFTALAITGSAMNNAVMDWITSFEPFGTLADQLTRSVPYLLVIGAFTFLYVLVPNTKVKLGPALIGGIVAGVLWQSAGLIFAHFVASATKYQAIYATFGTALIFMIWLYVSWLILLVGASAAFYVQQPGVVIAAARNLSFSYAVLEQYALAAATHIARNYYDRSGPLGVAELSVRLKLPNHLTARVLGALEQAAIVCHDASVPPRYLPAAPVDELKVVDVVRALRTYQPADSRKVPPPDEPVITALGKTLNDAAAQTLGDMTLKDLAAGEQPAVADFAARKSG